MAGFGAPVDDPTTPAGEHHEHSGRLQPALARGDVLPIFEWVAPAKGAHHQHQRGSADGGCAALLPASTCAARSWAQPLESSELEIQTAAGIKCQSPPQSCVAAMAMAPNKLSCPEM